MSFKENRRKKFTKKQKNRKIKCRKDEYYNKKTKTCNKKTKHPQKQTKKRQKGQKKQKKISIPISYSSNNNNQINLKSIKSVEKDTRIFLILGHSSLGSFKDIIDLSRGLERPDLRLDLKTDPIINQYENLKVVNFKSIGLNDVFFIYFFIKCLKENEKFYSSFIQINSIEKAQFLDKFYDYLFSLNTNTNYFKHTKDVHNDNLSQFKIYPKPNNPSYPQNPLNGTYSFYPLSENDDKFIKFGIYEITVPEFYYDFNDEISIISGLYKINDFLKNETLRNFYNIEKKIKIYPDPEDSEIKKIRHFLGIPDKNTMDILKKRFGELKIEQFNHLIKPNNKLFLEIKRKYKEDKSDSSKQTKMRKASQFKLDELIKILLEEYYISNDEKTIFLEVGCKGIQNLPYDIKKSLVIPKTGYWESSVQTLPYSITQGNPFF